jgi:uncharacterized membrane protein YhaH (DUF805 family)
MSFGEAIATCFRKYADFTGRATRPEYWWWFLFVVVVQFGSYLVVVGTIDPYEEVSGAIALPLLVSLALLLPNLAVFCRRLHDTNRSGWNWLIGLIPLIGGIVLLVFLASEGTPGPNTYGPDPRASSVAPPPPPY